MSDTLLVTSLSTGAIESQSQAVESWRRLGFSVASLNVQPDLEMLRPHFPDVEFVTANGVGGKSDCGSRISISDALAHLDSSGTPICGLIRPDVRLRASSNAVRFLTEEAGNSFVFASRTDIGSFADANGEVCKSGFDVFLFDHEVLKVLSAAEWCLGGSWWDLWLPYCLMPLPRRFPLKYVSFPLAFRSGGSEKGEVDDYEKYGMSFARLLDQGTYNALLGQSPEMRRQSLGAMRMGVAMAILFESRWLSCFPD